MPAIGLIIATVLIFLWGWYVHGNIFIYRMIEIQKKSPPGKTFFILMSMVFLLVIICLLIVANFSFECPVQPAGHFFIFIE